MSGPHGPAAEPVVITVCANGPLLVRGPVSVVNTDGEALELNRAAIALCRCGKSRLAPLCDGTHKLLRNRHQRDS